MLSCFGVVVEERRFGSLGFFVRKNKAFDSAFCFYGDVLVVGDNVEGIGIADKELNSIPLELKGLALFKGYTSHRFF